MPIILQPWWYYRQAKCLPSSSFAGCRGPNSSKWRVWLECHQIIFITTIVYTHVLARGRQQKKSRTPRGEISWNQVEIMRNQAQKSAQPSSPTHFYNIWRHFWGKSRGNQREIRKSRTPKLLVADPSCARQLFSQAISQLLITREVAIDRSSTITISLQTHLTVIITTAIKSNFIIIVGAELNTYTTNRINVWLLFQLVEPVQHAHSLSECLLVSSM